MKECIGDIIKSDNQRTKIARIHQGWWRAFVLNEPQGTRPNNPSKKVCSNIDGNTSFTGNFLTSEIADVVSEVLEKRKNDAPGLIQESRLKGNLLSSQPLCFNFFGALYKDSNLALSIISEIYPDITSVESVLFEFAPTPKQQFTNDNSAFDIAIEVSAGDKKGLIGIECKYTESFSPKEYSTERYLDIYKRSNGFNIDYDTLTKSKYNQLFRTQLIAEVLQQEGVYDFVNTMVFCSPDDESAKKIGREFKQLLNSNESDFQVVDYYQFLEIFQRQQLTQDQRELSMLLWVRYMAYELSESALNQYG